MAIDVTDAEFETRVIERSKEVPVVVDLWAPWCGPCRQIGPVLERMEAESDGAFELVKINVDENPQVANAMRAQSIPLVVGVKDGQVVDQFVGALPPAQIREFLDRLVPSDTDRLLAAFNVALAADDLETAESLLDSSSDTTDELKIARARLLAAQQAFDVALGILESLPSNGHDEVSRLIGDIRLRAAAGADLADLESKAATGDLAAVIDLGKAQAGLGDHQQALDTLLGAVKQDPGFDDGAARKAMIDLFGVIGSSDPMTREYRSKLSSLIF